MDFSFNLIDEGWIPVITLEGELIEVGLHELFARAHEFQEISCETPIMTASIFPVALAILHRVFGPEDELAWQALWENEQFPMEPITHYLDKWYDRFDLFRGERPFYQAKDDRVKAKSVIHLIHSIGNTGTLFTHENDEAGATLNPSTAAQYLVTAQYFRTAGLSGLEEKFTDGTYTRGVLFWADADILFQQLVLNLIRYPADEYMPTRADDMPVWERDDMFEARTVPSGYLDYLTWASNRVLYIPEESMGQIVVREMFVAPGLNLNPDVFSPQKRYERRVKKNEEGFSFLYFNSNKALWQNYHTLINLQDNNIRLPSVISWLADLSWSGVLDPNYLPLMTAIGMLADQAKPIFYRQETLPLPLRLLKDPAKVLWIEQGIEDAQAVDRLVFNSLKDLADHVLLRGAEGQPDPNNRKGLMEQWNVVQLYWIDLEPHFWTLVNNLVEDEPDAMSLWWLALRESAFNALETAIQMAGQEPWTLKGGIIADRKLKAGLRKYQEERNYL